MEGQLQRIVRRNLRRYRLMWPPPGSFADYKRFHRTYMGGAGEGEGNLTLQTLEKTAAFLGVYPRAPLIVGNWSERSLFVYRGLQGGILALKRRLSRGVAWVVRAKFTAGSLAHIENSQGKVLLVLPRFGSRGEWSLPGGFHKRQEDALKAAIREVCEETRLELAEGALTFRCQYRQKGASHYDHLYTAVVHSPPARLGPVGWFAKLEVIKVGWFDIRDPQMCPKLNHEAKTALEKLGVIVGFEVE
jgi:ADP-ribose pyrophosphatase YjhB (NUDIX family)